MSRYLAKGTYSFRDPIKNNCSKYGVRGMGISSLKRKAEET